MDYLSQGVTQALALLLHMDAASAKAIETAVRAAALAGTTVVAASHDMVWLSSLAARRLDLGRPA